MNIEKLKQVEIDSLDKDKLNEHKQNVLSLNKDEIVDYLKFAVDKFYKTEEEGDNTPSIIEFFNDDFKDFYGLILDNE